MSNPPPLPTPEPAPLGTLPYARPMPRSPRAAFHWGIFLWGEIIFLAWIGVLVFVMPRFEDVFRDFKIEMPLATKLLLGVAWVITRGGFVLLLAIPVGFGFISARLDPGGRRALRMCITVIMAGLVLFTAFALFEPMRVLIEGLSPNTGKR